MSPAPDNPMAVLEQLHAMSDERFLMLYQSLENRGFGPLDGEVAKQLKFRPQAIRKLPIGQRARRARKILEHGKNVELTYELFGTYLMKVRKELITEFLEATDIAHEDGMIGEESQGVIPSDDKVKQVVVTLDQKFDPEDVTLYLSICTVHWPESEAIRELWSKRTT